MPAAVCPDSERGTFFLQSYMHGKLLAHEGRDGAVGSGRQGSPIVRNVCHFTMDSAQPPASLVTKQIIFEQSVCIVQYPWTAPKT